MSILENLHWSEVLAHYRKRFDIHKRLLNLHTHTNISHFVQLLLGISDPRGNYSASEHSLGPQIMAYNTNAEQRVFDLAGKFISVSSGREVPPLIKSANLSYLKIGVGSEASCLMNPKVCWVANTRTIWTHLVIKHGDNISKANEELRLYRDAEADSEMAYKIWVQIHRELDVAMTRVAEIGSELAKKADVKAGIIKYIWADAISNALYELYS
jgi:hypothetical protein